MKPIVLEALDASRLPVIVGRASGNGLNIDDGGDSRDPAGLPAQQPRFNKVRTLLVQAIGQVVVS